jgi:hypothetical protein
MPREVPRARRVAEQVQRTLAEFLRREVRDPRLKPVTITPDMVGRTVAIFTAIEVKTPTGKPTPEQLHFVNRVKDLGGIAGIARSVDDVLAITTPIM